MRFVHSTAAAAAILAIASNANAEEPRRFGSPSQLVFSVDRLLPVVSYSYVAIESSTETVSTTTSDSGVSIAFVGREPSLGVLHTVPRLAADFSVGGGVTIGTGIALAFGLGGEHVERRASEGTPEVTRSNDAPKTTILGVAPRAGYVVALGRDLYLWPRVGIGFYSSTTTSEASSSSSVARSSTTDTLFSLDLEAQLVWSPLSHLLVHVGPLVDVPLVGTHATEFSQAGITQERSDDLRVFHIGASAGIGLFLDP